MLRLFLSLATLACATPAPAQDKAQLDAVSIHLFLATSGTLSPDVEAIDGFGARNFGCKGRGSPTTSGSIPP